MIIRIDIEYREFNSKYFADVNLAPNIIEYLSSDKLENLMGAITCLILKYDEKMTAK